MCESGGMAQTVNVIVCLEDRERLCAIVADRNRPLKHIQRANIVLLSAERLPVLEVARRAGISRPAVWRWQLRYGEQGVDGSCATRRASPAGRRFRPRSSRKCWS
jgi:hypothetical protein